ncbi:tetratricopeptide repeat protein [Defluviimonas denitrificans]|uniref:Tetratricopeptide repeat protein n=1 Tax=Albidovulum denitrificans TaxID=404881 RepID=A0A2S8S4J6_9RHOB|nr:tetratricopeptide repeat protein [Defluviimonas denitrificans]PQV55731.1 tetratricopeptide repeat protein [Defluviimonas denitrificans]
MQKLRHLPFVLAAGLAFWAAPASAADGEAGPYLAARLAGAESDYAVAAEYYARALAADPGNTMLIENAAISELARGSVADGLKLARQFDETGGKSQIADLLILADLAQNEDYAAAVSELVRGRSAGQLVDGLYRAWAFLGMGQMSEAAAEFDKVSAVGGLKSFGLYHKALALASVGDFEGADAIFAGADGGPLRATRHGILAHAQILSQLERDADAIALLNTAFGPEGDPAVRALRTRLEAGETVPFTLVSGPKDGIAEVFYTVASALGSENTDVNTLAYARVAEYLAPKDADAVLLVASILEGQGQHALASTEFDKIGSDDPAYLQAELGRAGALVASGQTDAAIEVLRRLAKDHPDRIEVWNTLGDTLRREERFEEAAGAYDEAIARISAEPEVYWSLYFARGICKERAKNWTGAEVDFKKALELYPDQPSVLNYLGYSYIDRNENLDDALKMIEKAAAERPDDGAIIDSLGWGLYRLGRYDEAVTQMEHAVELMPVDAVVNDHLGDVYWAVGRTREAEFQWRRALSFAEDSMDADPDRIRRKLAVGLDKVLAEEGAKPLAVSKNGD